MVAATVVAGKIVVMALILFLIRKESFSNILRYTFLFDDDCEENNYRNNVYHIFENVNDINIIQKYAPKIKIEIYGGIDEYKFANQVLTGGADKIGSNSGYEIVKRYKELRENTQVKPKPITLTKKD